jgi:GrpB-like predicted nucleotidyltransferase (UPF0157 family)
MMNSIVVVDYDPVWPELFQFFRARIMAALGGLAAAVEHVGSTAVVGLAAKPVIDMDVLLVSAGALPAAIERLAIVGYSHQGDLGIAEREAFSLPPTTFHITFTCARHPAASIADTWRCETIYARTQERPKRMAT